MGDKSDLSTGDITVGEILTDGPMEDGRIMIEAVAVDGADNDGSDYEVEKVDEDDSPEAKNILDAERVGSLLKNGSAASLDAEDDGGAEEGTQQHQRSKSVKFGENSIVGIENNGAGGGDADDGIAGGERKSSVEDCEAEQPGAASEADREEEEGLNGVEFDDVEEEEEDTGRKVTTTRRRDL